MAIAGCGSSGSSSSTGSSSTEGGSGESASAGGYSKGGSEEASTTASEEGSSGGEGSSASEGSSGGGTAVAVGTASGVGQVLVDSKGMTLYYFQKDQKGSGKSKCEGACASAWPPLTTSGEGQAMSGVQSSMLGTLERADGTTQVTYAGWPLYTFVEDKKPGEDNGTDSKAFGASWYPLHPNGEKAGH
jgi:predicted lipoprotein with Yx(FWY)xxD motif